HSRVDGEYGGYGRAADVQIGSHHGGQVQRLRLDVHLPLQAYRARRPHDPVIFQLDLACAQRHAPGQAVERKTFTGRAEQVDVQSAQARDGLQAEQLQQLGRTRIHAQEAALGQIHIDLAADPGLVYRPGKVLPE